MNIKVSHEVPIDLLKASREFNDYDYALVHLFEDHPEYFQFFVESLEMGREVILDNSVFELRKAFDPDRFVYWIEKLRPTKYIVPDVIEDGEATIKLLAEWNERYPNVPGIKMAVVQGKTYEEICGCYNYHIRNADEVCINLCKTYGRSQWNTGNRFLDYSLGRVTLIHEMMNDQNWDPYVKHHLLGCSLPLEFGMYQDVPSIISLDTSSPVVHGILGKKYDEFGIKKKEELKLFELIDHKTTEEQMELILHNVAQFKQIVDTHFKYGGKS